MLQDVLINLKTNTQNSKKSNSFRILKYIKLQHSFVGVFFLNFFQDLIYFGIPFQVGLSIISFFRTSKKDAISIPNVTYISTQLLPLKLKHYF